MNILALDLGGATGWCALIDGRLHHGVERVQKSSTESEGIRVLAFRGLLRRLIGMAKPDVLVFEEPHHRGKSTRPLMSYRGEVVTTCTELAIECASVHSGTLKKHATGRGNASKDDMVVAAVKNRHVFVSDDNEADAVHMVAWACDKYGEKMP